MYDDSFLFLFLQRRCTYNQNMDQNLILIEAQLMAQGNGVGIGPGGRVVQVATEEEINSIPVVKFHEGMFAEDDNRCAICLSDYEKDDSVKTLGCGHHFNVDCIDRWLKNSRNCPLCQQDITRAHNVRSSSVPSPKGEAHTSLSGLVALSSS